MKSGFQIRWTPFFLILLFLSGWHGQDVTAQSPMTAVVWSPDGNHVVAGSQSGIRVVDVKSGEASNPIQTRMGFIYGVRFSRAGDLLSAVGGSPGESGSVEVYSWPEKKLVHQFEVSEDVVYDSAWSSDGKFLALACHDTNCYLLDLESASLERTWIGHSRPVSGIQSLPKSSVFVTSAFDQTIRLWKPDQPSAIRSLDNHTASIQALAVAPEADIPGPTLIASIGQDKTVRFWQPEIGRMLRFARVASSPLCVEWDVKGREVLVGCENGDVLIVDSRNAEIKSTRNVFKGPIFCIARHPLDNVFMVGAYDGRWQRLDFRKP